MRQVDWWFDFISPFSYFAFQQLDRLPADVTIRYRPVLFAGLLKHWGQKGPAEIVPKRRWTYRWCVWWSQQQGIAFIPPAAHPFNPLPYLRLALAAELEPQAISRIFDALWTTGGDPADLARVQALATALGIDLDRLDAPEIKSALRANTEAAAAAGVFGVPTLSIGEDHFWGADALPFALASLADPSLLCSPAMQRVDALPVAQARPGL